MSHLRLHAGRNYRIPSLWDFRRQACGAILFELASIERPYGLHFIVWPSGPITEFNRARGNANNRPSNYPSRREQRVPENPPLCNNRSCLAAVAEMSSPSSCWQVAAIQVQQIEGVQNTLASRLTGRKNALAVGLRGRREGAEYCRRAVADDAG